MVLQELAQPENSRSSQRMKHLLMACAARLKPLWTQANEAVLGISTTAQAEHPGSRPTLGPGWWKGEHSDDARHDDNFQYATIDYWNLRKVIRALRPKHDDVFYDIGCGKGRVLCCMARNPLKKCVGIELFEPLCQIARANASSLRARKTPIQVIRADAAVADLSDGTIYWLFNPFGEQTLRDALSNIQRSVVREPRRITIVYYNPTCEHLFTESGWLRKTRQTSAPGGGVATFWQNRE